MKKHKQIWSIKFTKNQHETFANTFQIYEEAKN